MDWFGLNWMDILLGTAFLAVVPFLYALYSGYIATETIEDRKHRRRVKLNLWALFVVGVSVGFWQQLRAAESDFTKETKENWAAALLKQGLDQQQRLHLPVPCLEHGSVPQGKPDISMGLIGPESFGIELLNKSNVLLKSPKWWFILWDLDKDEPNSNGQPLGLPIPSDSGDWIRPHEGVGPEAVITSQLPIQNGDRLLGFVGLSCPDCVRNKLYLIYAVQGQNGWYAEIPGNGPDLTAVTKSLPDIRKNPEPYLKYIPESKRIPIATTLSDPHLSAK